MKGGTGEGRRGLEGRNNKGVSGCELEKGTRIPPLYLPADVSQVMVFLTHSDPKGTGGHHKGEGDEGRA